MVQPGVWREEAGFAQALERAGHAAATVTVTALDGARSEAFVLLFGGRRGDNIFSDVLAYDVARREWSEWCERWPCAPPRSYHTATVVSGEVWLCGGGDSSSVLADVLVYRPATRTWHQPKLRGDTGLLRRTAHGACVHPQRPHSILLMGGYGGAGEDFKYLNDIVELDTHTGSVRPLHAIGTPPDARAYHAWTAVGQRCYCVAGRTHDNRLIKGKQTVVVFDAAACKWVVPGVVDGELTPRSSHRMAAVPGGALLFGGAVDKGNRAGDLQLLVTGHGRLSWRLCAFAGASSSSSGGTPAARGAHAVEIAGGRLYVIGGYGEGRQYTPDCWSLSLEAIGGCDAAPPAKSPLQRKDGTAKQSGGTTDSKAAVPQAEASQWREARRSCPAAAFGGSTAKRQRVAAGAAGVRAAAAAPAAAAAAATGPPPCSAALPQQAQQQQQQQVLPQVLFQAAPAACNPRLVAESAELQLALQREKVAAAAQAQQLLDLQRHNSELKADCASWRRKAEEEQAAGVQSNAVLQQRSAEVAEAQRLLRAAQQEAAKAESDLLDLRSQQRRDRDKVEDEVRKTEKRVAQLECELAEARKSNSTLSASMATATDMLAKVQAQLLEEQQRAGEARVAAANERERLSTALRDASDQAREAAQQRDQLSMRLEAEQRSVKEAREEGERQQAQARAAQQQLRKAEEEGQKVRQEADEARARAAAAQAVADRARAATARVDQAMQLLAKAKEDMGGG